MKNRLTIILVLFLGLHQFVNGQKTLGFDEYINIVKLHHPIAFQAKLQIEKGDAKLLKAKGGFDPKLNGNINQKYFNGSQYYSYLHSGLVIPTWFGVSLEAGYENNQGSYLNPEYFNPDNGLVNAGISITLGKGLFIDERRAELKQAKIYQNSSELEQKIILNQLILNASITYQEWKKTYLKLNIYKEAYRNAQERFNGVKESARLGDKPSIDTVEAKIVVQNRLINYEQSLVDFKNKSLKLGVYLWQDGFIPLELDSITTPDSSLSISSVALAYNDSVVNKHPEIELYKNKIEIQEIDIRLKKEALKPVLNLKYSFINEPVNSNPIPDFDVNNYKWGAYLSYPIFTRKERGEIKLSQIRMKEVTINQEYKKAQLKYKIQALRNLAFTSQTQYSISQNNVVNSTRMFDSEMTLFNIGESSVFMVNSRENSLIKSQLKMIDFYSKTLIFQYQFDYHLFTN